MKVARQAVSQPSDVDAALAALGADDLREVVREAMGRLDERAHEAVAGAIIRRAARGPSGWAPAAVSEREVAEAVAFAERARQDGTADPSEVDERLGRGTAAFLRKDYAAAHRIYGALLPMLADGDVDLGQDELVSEVLGVDTDACAAQYVVAAYMLAAPAARADAVRAAMREVDGVGYFFEPIRDMERAAGEALPGLDDFLPRWRAVVEGEAAGGRRADRHTETDQWLREVVGRMEGPAGLAAIARRSSRPDDLRAWCRSLVEAADWRAALPAFEEAAELAREAAPRAEFLDGAAFAAQRLGEADVSPWLERAWRAEPTMARLLRWLGRAGAAQAMQARIAEALAACPQEAQAQLALLRLLHGDVAGSAKLLAEAPGLGWSGRDHPGHQVFPLFAALLGCPASAAGPSEPGSDREPPEFEDDEGDRRIATPPVDEIVRAAGVEGVRDPRSRALMLAAMREAAEARVAGVTGQKRRRHYGHAASLVAACVACDRSPETDRWVATLRGEYRRFPALREELDRRIGSA